MIYDIMHPGWGEHHLPWVRKEEDDWGDWGAVEQDFNCFFLNWKIEDEWKDWGEVEQVIQDTEWRQNWNIILDKTCSDAILTKIHDYYTQRQ